MRDQSSANATPINPNIMPTIQNRKVTCKNFTVKINTGMPLLF
mgnify:CR=1 FL=1